MYAVGVAALLAQEHVETGVEEPAEQGIGDREGMEVIDATLGANVADTDLGLGRAGSVHEHDAPAGSRLVRVPWA